MEKKYKVEKVKTGEMSMTLEEAETFLGKLDEVKSRTTDEREVAKALELTVISLRKKRHLALRMRRNQRISEAKALKADGFSLTEIAKRMGLTAESSVRELCTMDETERPHIDEFRLVKVRG